MNIRTKILTVAALLAVWSCAEKEITPTAPDGSKPIEFGSLSTRALVNSIDAVNEFGVSCAISNADNSDYGSIMDNVKVERSDKSDTGWDYNPKRYWLDNSSFYFVASYPYVEDGGFRTITGTTDGLNQIAYSLDVVTPPTADLDILTATEYVNTNDNWTTEAVRINLGHLMTKINFKIKQNVQAGGDPDNYYYITKVTLSHVKNKGSYNIVPTNGGFISQWIMEDIAISSYIKEFNPPIELTNANSEQDKTKSVNVLSVWEGEELLLIPQKIIDDNNQMRIRIDYKYRLSGTEEQESYYIEERIPVSADLWQSGKWITYNISIAEQNDITFDPPRIIEWGATPGTGTTVIIK